MTYGSIEDLADDNYYSKGHCYSNNNNDVDMNSLELMFLYVNDYKLFKNVPINLNAHYEFEFKNDNSLYIKENKDFVNLFGSDINLKIFCGKNGTGKSTIINLLRDIDSIKSKKCFIVLKDKNSKFITNKRDLNIILNNENFACQYAMDNNFKISSLSMSLNKQNNVAFCTKRKLTHNYMLYKSLYDKCVCNSLFDHFEIRFWEFEENIKRIISKISLSEQRSTYDIYPEDLYTYFQTNPLKYIILKKTNEEFYENFKPKDFILSNIISETDIIKYIDALFQNFMDYSHIKVRNYGELNNELLKFIYNFPYIANSISNYNHGDEYLFKEYPLNNDYYIDMMEEFEDLVKDVFEIMAYQPFFEGSFLLNRSDNDFIELFYLKPFKKVGINRIYPESYSEGEFSKIKMVTDLITSIYGDNTEKTILLNDEIDAHIHPSWAKDYLYEYLNIIKENNMFVRENLDKKQKKSYNTKKLNIIITTHSPFILSDVTNEYIEYLDKSDTNGFLKDKSQIHNTFAGNILQMFANNFFLDSTMGKYSKEILKEIISFLSNEKISQPFIVFASDMSETDKLNKCKQIINSVGDDILRRILQEKLERFKQNETN